MTPSDKQEPGSIKSSENDLTRKILREDFKTEILNELCRNNGEYFSKDNSENGQRMYISFLSIIETVDRMWPKILEIQDRVSEFDFDEDTPGNGYRSFLKVVKLAIELAISINERVLLRRDSVLFRKNNNTKDVESCSHLMVSLDSCLDHLQILLSWSVEGNLFVTEDHAPNELFTKCGEVNQHCFYGRNLGFQYCESIRNVLQFIAISMALFSEVYYSEGSLITKATSSVMSTTKYITDPEQRARRIVNISQNAEVDFCKAFWFLSEAELMNQIPSIVSPSVAVCKVIQLPPEPLHFTTAAGKEVEVPVPSSHIGKKCVQVRLISYNMREGMIGSKGKTNLLPPSKGLIIQCHGGGFVAQSSKSHEGYLRDWAKYLDIPILCIDYSLAPEAPFPRALEEIFYAYCWAKNNCQLLGSTGEDIVGIGDSAGANLLLTTTLKCIHMEIPTVKGLFLAYAPTGIHFIPSPARLLCMMDPLLPFGFLMRCLKAYACPPKNSNEANSSSAHTSDTESFEEITESDLMELQAHKSPISEASDTITYGSLTDNDDNNASGVDPNKSELEKNEKLMTDLLGNYVLGKENNSVSGVFDSDTDTEATKVANAPSTSSSQSTDSVHSRVFSFVSNLKSQLTKYLGERTLSAAEKLLDVGIDSQTSMVDKFTFSIPKDPYLSPIFTEEEDLKKYPPTRILSVDFDPCLDDCVMYAKMLKKAGNDVKLDILPGLPHGFLNFSLFSKEAYMGSQQCVERIQELLNLDH